MARFSDIVSSSEHRESNDVIIIGCIGIYMTSRVGEAEIL
jgi:hypothetical protein